MQTRNFRLRGIALALAGVLTLGLTACEDTDVVAPTPVSTLTVSPAGPLDLNVGNTVQLVANVQNSTNTAVTYTTSNAAVATVNASGVITAVGAGTATVTATAQGNQGTLQQGVFVRVTAPTTPPPPPGVTPSVAIQSITTQSGAPVNTAGAQGLIFVNVQFERGNADSLTVSLGNQVVCRQRFGAAAGDVASGLSAEVSVAEFQCPINTAELNANGTPRFPNAATTVSARLWRGNTAIDQASQPITLANVSSAQIQVAADSTAIGADGLLWHGGNLTITVNPATFAGGQTIGQVQITVTDMRTGQQIVQRTDASAPFTTTVNATGGASNVNPLAGITTDSLQITVSTATTGGAVGPTATRVIRYDAVAPRAIVATAPATGWFGDVTFGTSGAGNVHSAVPDSMPGVGGVTVTYHVVPFAGTGGLTTAQIVAQGTQVTGTAGLEQTNTTSGYRLVVRARDALGNTRLSNAIPFGIDRVAPTATATVTGGAGFDSRVNPTSFQVALQDTLSGFTATPLLLSVVRADSANPSGTCVVGTGSGCTAVASASSYTIPATNGYYTITYSVRDRAGNTTASQTVTVLRDTRAPGVRNINFPVSLTGGASTTFSARATDNVDLHSVAFGFFFGDPAGTHYGALPFEDQVIDATFGAPLTTAQDVSETTQYIRGIWVNGTWYPTTNVVVTALDMARNSVAGTQPVSTPFNAPTLVPLASFNIVAPAEGAAISNTGTGTTAPTSRTVTARAVSNNVEASAPFARVHFYEEIGGVRRLLGTVTSSTQITGETTRSFDYSFTYTPGRIAAGAVQIFAVGVEADGDANRTDNVRTLNVQGTL